VNLPVRKGKDTKKHEDAKTQWAGPWSRKFGEGRDWWKKKGMKSRHRRGGTLAKRRKGEERNHTVKETKKGPERARTSRGDSRVPGQEKKVGNTSSKTLLWGENSGGPFFERSHWPDTTQERRERQGKEKNKGKKKKENKLGKSRKQRKRRKSPRSTRGGPDVRNQKLPGEN